MLCINCQWDEFGVSDGGHSSIAGDFYKWRWSTNTPNIGMYCGDGYNQTLPDSLQQVVCNQGLHLSDFLYSIFWPDGSWDFSTFEVLAKQNLATHNDQSLDFCPNNTGISTISHTTTAWVTITSQVTSQTSTEKVNRDTVAVVGGALGGATALVLLGAIVAVIYIKKRYMAQCSRSNMGVAEDKLADPSTGLIIPFLGQSPREPSTVGLSQRTASLPTARGEADVLPHASYSMRAASDNTAEASDHPSTRPTIAPWENVRPNGPPRSVDTSPLGAGIREHDGGYTIQESRFPPEYRTVYSGSG